MADGAGVTRRPPAMAERLLKAVLPKGSAGDAVLGDLHEELAGRDRGRPAAAASWYWRQTLGLTCWYLWEAARRSLATQALRVAGGGGGTAEAAVPARDAGIAVLLLAVAGGGALFSLGVLDGFLLRPLPSVPAGDVYALRLADSPPGTGTGGPIELIAWDLDTFTTPARPDRALEGAWITPGILSRLGLTPALGSDLGTAATPDEPTPALIAFDLWHGRYAGDPEVIGHELTLEANDRPHEGGRFVIVGVLPEGFWLLHRNTQILVPLSGLRRPSLAVVPRGASGQVASARASARWQALSGEDAALEAEPLRQTWLAPVADLLGGTGAVALGLLAAGLAAARAWLVRGAARRGAASGISAPLLALSSVAGLALVGGLLLALAVFSTLGPAFAQRLWIAVPDSVWQPRPAIWLGGTLGLWWLTRRRLARLERGAA